MLSVQLIKRLNANNVKYEIIHYSQLHTDSEIAIGTKLGLIETARSIIVNADAKLFYVLTSVNYSINKDILKEVFKSKKLEVITQAKNNTLLSENDWNNIVIDKILVESAETILLRLEKNQGFIKVKTSDFNLVVKPRILDLCLLPKYRAKISFVSPESQRDKLEMNESCFLGVSLENSNFIRPKLMASLEWISNRFSYCCVLIGDSIHRITLESQQNLNPEEAKDKALCLGQEFLYREKTIFKKYSRTCQFKFVLCSEIQEYHDYAHYHDTLKNLYQQNDLFSSSVRAFGEKFHTKSLEPINQEELEIKIEMSSRYFLEEFAIFACLQSRGYKVMIYPGSFSTLTEIANGKHPNALTELKNLTIVSLQLKKR